MLVGIAVFQNTGLVSVDTLYVRTVASQLSRVTPASGRFRKYRSSVASSTVSPSEYVEYAPAD